MSLLMSSLTIFLAVVSTVSVMATERVSVNTFHEVAMNRMSMNTNDLFVNVKKMPEMIDTTAAFDAKKSNAMLRKNNKVDLTSASGNTESNFTAIQTTVYQIDNSTVYHTTAFVLDRCFCVGSVCQKYVLASQDTTSYTINDVYYGDTALTTNCTGDPQVSYPTVYPFVTYQDKDFSCYTGGDDDEASVVVKVKVTNALVTGTAPYSTLGEGFVVLEYQSSFDCHNNATFYYAFYPSYSCESNVKNSVCYPTNSSQTIVDSTTVKTTQYDSKACTNIKSYSVSTLIEQKCVATSNGIYTNTILQGGSNVIISSNDDDDNVSLSQLEYGFLIASVFVALLVVWV